MEIRLEIVINDDLVDHYIEMLISDFEKKQKDILKRLLKTYHEVCFEYEQERWEEYTIYGQMIIQLQEQWDRFTEKEGTP